MPPSRSHKPITYGRSSREKSQPFTNDAPRLPRFRSKSNEQQGNSTWLNSPGPQQPKMDRQQESKKMKTFDNQPGSSERSSPLHEYPDPLRSFTGDEKEKEDSHTTERKRRKFVSDNQGPLSHKTGNYGSSRHSMKVANSLSADRSGAPNNVQPGSEARPNSGRRHTRHMSENITLQSHLDMSKGRGGKIGARKKLVNSLGSVDSSNKGLSASGESDEKSSSFQSPFDSTMVQRSITPPRKPSSRPDKTNLHDTCGLEDSATVSPSGLRASKVTYGRQRSFLNEAPVSGCIEDQDDNSQQPQGQLASESISHVGFQVDDDMSDSNGPVRSIHELRQAGDNARFRGAIDGIFEEIASSRDSVSTRCNGFVQLSLRLFDRRFSRRFSESGFVGKFVHCLTKDLDVISASFAFCSYELIHTSGVFSPTDFALVWPKLLGLSHKLLDTENDILSLSKRREFGISKIVQSSVRKAIPMLSATISDDPPLSKLSPRLIALRCISSCLRGLQRNGDNVEPMHVSILNQLVGMLVLKDPGALISPEDFQMVFWVLSILEAYMTLADSLSIDHRDILRPIAQLYHILELKESELNDRSREIRILYIKVILNLTNNNSSFWTEFVKPELLGALLGVSLSKFCELTNEHLVEEKSTLDTVILALGTLINLTQRSDLARTMFLTTTKNSTSFLQMLLKKFSAANIDLVTEVCEFFPFTFTIPLDYILCPNKHPLPAKQLSYHSCILDTDKCIRPGPFMTPTIML